MRILVEEDLADHIDLNFGCPAQVMRKGGGWRCRGEKDLLAAILARGVRACDESRAGAASNAVPVTS